MALTNNGNESFSLSVCLSTETPAAVRPVQLQRNRGDGERMRPEQQ